MMKKIVVASLGLALAVASPLAAQTAKKMTKEELMKWAADGGYCKTKSVLDAAYQADGRVKITCGTPAAGTRAGAGAGGTLAGGLAGGSGAIAGAVAFVVVAAAAGGGSSTGSTPSTPST